VGSVPRRRILRGGIVALLVLVILMVVMRGVIGARVRRPGGVVVPAAMLPGRLRHRATRITLGAVPHRDRSHTAQRQGDERHEQDQGFELSGHVVRV
jgi:hypothetical protein